MLYKKYESVKRKPTRDIVFSLVLDHQLIIDAIDLFNVQFGKAFAMLLCMQRGRLIVRFSKTLPFATMIATAARPNVYNARGTVHAQHVHCHDACA